MQRNISGQNLVIDVFTKDGESYIARDIPEQPTGRFDRFVCFWQDQKLHMIPMERVHHFHLYEGPQT